jgi:hypothetical protein
MRCFSLNIYISLLLSVQLNDYFQCDYYYGCLFTIHSDVSISFFYISNTF